MYDLFLLSSSRRADPRDASLVEISLQRFPYKYRAAVIARRAFPTKVRIDKKRSLSLFFSFSRETLEISITNFIPGSRPVFD